MANPAITPPQRIIGDFVPDKSGILASRPVEEKLQKLLDKALYANVQPTAQKIRNFLNGTWLGEPLHVVLKDAPIGAWTVAIIFDVLDLIRNKREFSLAADTSIAIGLWGAAGAAVTGITDWSDVDPPARRLGLVHGLLNVGVTALFTTSLILRKRKSRAGGRVSAAFGYGLLSLSAHLGGKMVYEQRVGVDRTAGEVFRKTLWLFSLNRNWRTECQRAQSMRVCPFCWFVVDRQSSRWRRRARISVGRFLKANWLGTVLFVHITPLDLLLTMAVCLTGQPCIRSRAWRSGCETARSKCASHRRKADIWVLLANRQRSEDRQRRMV
jgi:uncharacterized membrane protein